MSGHKVLNVLRHRLALHVAAGLDFPGDILRGIVRPMLQGVECDHPDRVVELSGWEIRNDCFEVGLLDLCFSVNAAAWTEAVNHQVDGLIRPVGNRLWSPAGTWHTRTQLRQEPNFGFKSEHYRSSTENKAPDRFEALPTAPGYIRPIRLGCYSAMTCAGVNPRARQTLPKMESRNCGGTDGTPLDVTSASSIA